MTPTKWQFTKPLGGWKKRCLNYAKCKKYCVGGGKKYCTECHERKDYLRAKYAAEQMEEGE